MAKRDTDEARPQPEELMEPGREREPERRDREDDVRGLAGDEDDEEDIDDADLDEEDGA
jgi:hypothetical protein